MCAWTCEKVCVRTSSSHFPFRFAIYHWFLSSSRGYRLLLLVCLSLSKGSTKTSQQESGGLFSPRESLLSWVNFSNQHTHVCAYERERIGNRLSTRESHPSRMDSPSWLDSFQSESPESERVQSVRERMREELLCLRWETKSEGQEGSKVLLQEKVEEERPVLTMVMSVVKISLLGSKTKPAILKAGREKTGKEGGSLLIFSFWSSSFTSRILQRERERAQLLNFTKTSDFLQPLREKREKEDF